MSTIFKKAMLYLGLGSDEDFMGMDPITRDEPVQTEKQASQPKTGVNVRPIPPDESSKSERPGSGAVITIPPPKRKKPHVVTPVRFAEVKEIS